MPINIQPLLNQASEQLSRAEGSSFSLSTSIPLALLIEEEKIWDKKLQDESIKNKINRIAVAELCKQTGKKYDPEGSTVRVIINLESSKVDLENQPVFLFGRYEKHEKDLSQSRWKCRRCEGDGCFYCDYKGKYYVSVEEIIGDVLQKYTGCRNYVLHASGREDTDAKNTAGRPFVFEIIEPEKTTVDLLAVEKEINDSGKVKVSSLAPVRRSFVETVTESHFDKEYETTIEFERDITEDDIEKIISLSGQVIEQRTPHRVAHRRADLNRKRKIKQIKIIRYEKNLATVIIEAEAGTYIKELISGDKGRTKPSVSELLGCKAKCESLTVTKIHDGFLDVLQNRGGLA